MKKFLLLAFLPLCIINFCFSDLYCKEIDYDRTGGRIENEKFYYGQCVQRIQTLLNAGSKIDKHFADAFIENGIDPDTFRLSSGQEGFDSDEARDTLQEVCKYYGEHREDLDRWQLYYEKAFDRISYEDFMNSNVDSMFTEENDSRYALDYANHIIGYLISSLDYLDDRSPQYSETVQKLEKVHSKCYEMEDKQNKILDEFRKLLKSCKTNYNKFDGFKYINYDFKNYDEDYEDVKNTIETCQATLDYVESHPGLDGIIQYSDLKDARTFLRDVKSMPKPDNNTSSDNNTSLDNNTPTDKTTKGNENSAFDEFLKSNGFLPTDTSNNTVENNNGIESSPQKAYDGYSTELSTAYDFAFKNKITSINDINKADMFGFLTRIAMAKMLSQYAIGILGKTPDTSRIPKFNDVDIQLDNDYNNGVTLAYQLGIMGVGIDNFRPYDLVTRGEFATALSRMLYGIKDGNPFYTTHLSKLKKEGIISVDNPEIKEIRGYVMLMLMRSAK